jgi:hypothetical protein
MRKAHLVDLTPYCNSFAATFDADRAAGVMNAWGNSFPAEELPLGAAFVADGFPFQLPPKRVGHWDHVEALGQTIQIEGSPVVSEIALLCCGEMGDQKVEIEAHAEDGQSETITVATRGWLVPGDTAIEGAAFRSSHLHYVGDYELALLTPALWTARQELRRPMPLSELRLGRNPLFHIFGLTLSEVSAGA